MSHAQSLLYRMDNGFPGQVTRLEHSTLEAAMLTEPLFAGTLVMRDPNNPGLLKAVDSASLTLVYGIVTRSFPEMTAADQGYPDYNENDYTVPPTMPSDRAVSILRSGYMAIRWSQLATVPTKAQALTIRWVTNTNSDLWGGITTNVPRAILDVTAVGTSGAVALPNSWVNGYLQTGFTPVRSFEIIFNI